MSLDYPGDLVISLLPHLFMSVCKKNSFVVFNQVFSMPKDLNEIQGWLLENIDVIK